MSPGAETNEVGTGNETLDFVEGLARIMRAVGVTKAAVGDITLELGPPPPKEHLVEHRLLTEAEQQDVKRKRQADLERLMYAASRP